MTTPTDPGGARLRAGWLVRELERSQQQADELPRWLRRAAGLGDGPGKLERLAADNARWRALVGRMMPYTKHGLGCPKLTNEPLRDCTCGLDTLKAQAALDGGA